VYKVLGRNALWGATAPKDMVAKDYAMLKRDKYSPSGVIAQSTGIAAFSMTLESAAAIAVPTLVQHGTADKAVKFELGQQIADTIPGAKLSVYEGAGHNSLVFEAARFNREALDFLGDVDRSTDPATATA